MADPGPYLLQPERRIRVWTHDENGLDSLLVEREQVAFILQQHHTLAGSLQGNLAAFLVVPRDGKIGLVAHEPFELHRLAQDAPDLVVNRRDGDFALLDRGEERRRAHEGAGGPLQL